MDNLNETLAPGMFVRHPVEDWGVGQVQSNVCAKVTVNFPQAGKVVIDSTHLALVMVFDRSAL